MSERFSLEILFTIFTHLPVKSLMRFRCVSKSCCSLIDSPEFTNAHPDLNNNRKLILGDWHLEGWIYLIDLDASPLISPLNIERLRKPSVETPDNFIPINPDGVFGSCNGVVAMYNKQGISLWNPSTNMFKSFPLWIVDIVFDGFGYDSVSGDYKVIMLTKLFSEDFLRVMIYSVKNNSLRRIDDLHSPVPYAYDYEISGVLVGFVLHWVAHPRGVVSAYHNFILAFDLRDETFHQVPQPRDMIDVENKVFDVVSELGGCLSISYRYQGRVDIWIMKEYGIEDSWTKLVSLHSRENFSLFYRLKPLCYSKEGDKVLLDYNKGTVLILYDLKDQSVDGLHMSKASERKEKTYCVCKCGFICATTPAFPIVNGGSSKKMPRKKNIKSNCKRKARKRKTNIR
ncbi:F-box protein CPR1-like [Mercurialis annua]|uniref:F-box protein CPR1-like n=1 Tax=Mercurialis annua TaxID=3986 RepID=UPI00215E2418|nr:F-box protein CPR1-like [Mercurialis annua]